MLPAFGTKAIILHGYICFSNQDLLNRIDNKVIFILYADILLRNFAKLLCYLLYVFGLISF